MFSLHKKRKSNILSKFGVLFIIALVFFVSNFISVVQAAEVPTIIGYQGRLADADGNLLGGAGTNYHFKISFWTSPTVGVGTKVWPTGAPSDYTTMVRHGLFNINIGDTANGYPDALDYNFSNNSNVYLQVEVSTDGSSFETVSPRQAVASAPFALVAGSVSGSGASTMGSLQVNGNSTTTGSSYLGNLAGLANQYISQWSDLANFLPASFSSSSADLWASTKDFTSNILGVLGINHGGTGTSTAPGVGQVLVGNASGGYDFVAASSLSAAILNTNNTWTGTNNFNATTTFAGNVGIGVADPGTFKLNVNGAIRTSNNYFYVGATSPWLGFVTDGGSALPIKSGSLAIGNNYSSAVAPANGLYVQGNIGIGTTTPLAKLVVQGTSTTPLLSINTSSSASALFVASNGYVGVGTTTPGAMLDIYSSDPAKYLLNLTGDSTAHGLGLTFLDISSAGSSRNWAFGASIAGGYGWDFMRSTSKGGNPTTLAMRIDNNGNLGIGPSFVTGAASKLSVTGNASFGTNFYNVAAPADGMIIEGNVGIGTAAPSTKLEVRGGTLINGVTAGTETYLQFRNSSTPVALLGTDASISAGAVADVGLYVYGNNNFDFWTNATRRLRITGSGNVGIGTTTPTQKLDVVGNININSTSSYMLNGVNVVYGSTTLYNYFFGAAGNTSMTGIENIAVGVNSFTGNTSGSWNTANGVNALHLNTTGNYNTAMGNIALNGVNSGSNNTGIGYQALSKITDVNNNTALGYQAGRFWADGATALATTSQSVYIGSGAMGYNNSDVNSIVIGYQAKGIGANSVVLGNDSILNTALKGSVGIGTTTPAAPLHLAVTGAPMMQWDRSGTQIGLMTAANNDMNFIANTNLRLGAGNIGSQVSLLANGNFGIGSTNPAYILDVVGPAASYGQARIKTQTTGWATRLFLDSGTLSSSITYYDNVSGMEFKTNGSTKLVVMDSGRVGIGSSSPQSLLTVQGTSTNSLVSIMTSSSVSAIFVDANGYVGVGTASPTYPLDIRGYGSGVSQLHFNSGTGDDGGYIRSNGGSNLNISGGAAYSSGWRAKSTEAAIINTNGYSPGDMVFFTNTGLTVGNVFSPTPRLYIAPTGNVGIGTTSPGSMLTVQAVAGTSPLNIASSTGASMLYIASNGFVGVGTVSPATNLDVVGSGSVSTNWTVAGNLYNNSLRPYYDSALNLGGNSIGGVNILTSNIRRLSVDNSGLVGIGTTSPSATLAVMGTSSLPSINPFVVASSSGATMFAVAANGNVGIGTSTPGAALDVMGPMWVGDNRTGSGFYKFTGTGGANYIQSGLVPVSGSAAPLYFTSINNGNTWMTLSNVGNLGIGTTSPAARLAVTGSASDNTKAFIVAGSTDIPKFWVSGNGTLGTYIDAQTNFTTVQRNPGLLGFLGNSNDYFMNYDTANLRVIIGNGGLASSTLTVTGNASIGTGYATTSAPTNGLIVQGNVGIGTASPSQMLQVGDTLTSGSRQIFITDSGTGLRLSNGSGSGAYIQSAGTNVNLEFRAGNSNNMNYVFSSTGNVGIGTSTPQVKLDVVASDSGNTPIFSTNYNGAGGMLALRANGTMASPTALLANDLIGGMLVRGYNGSGFTSASNGGVYIYAGENWTGSNNGTYMTFATTQNGGSRTEKLRVTGDGYIGIGTSTPTVLLDVGSDQKGTVANLTGGASGANILTFNRTNGLNASAGINLGNGRLNFSLGVYSPTNSVLGAYYGDPGSGNMAQILAGADLGSNTSVGVPGMFRGTNAGTSGTDISGGDLYLASGKGNGIGSPSNIYFQTPNIGVSGTTQQSYSTKLTILGTGNVGIGTTTPASTLMVQGTSGVSALNIASPTGSSMFTVLANGNVGVGTANPGYASYSPVFQVGGSSDSNYTSIYANNSNSAYGSFFQQSEVSGATLFFGTYGSTNAGSSIFGVARPQNSFMTATYGLAIGTNGANANLTLGTAGSARVTILNTGNVGIGTTTPLATLTVQATSGASALNIASSTGASMLSVAANGNVGIGTTTPVYPLDIFNNYGGGTGLNIRSSDNNYRPGIRQEAIRPTPAGVAYNLFESYIGNDSRLLTRSGAIGTYGEALSYPITSTVYYMYLGAEATAAYNNNTLRLYPDKRAYFDGNVGVGALSPLAKLEVDADASGIGQIIKANATTPGNLMEFRNSSGALLSRINADGTFNLNAGSVVIGSNDIKTYYLNNPAGTTPINLNVNGNIGIGTTTPLATLTVQATSGASALNIASSTGASMLTVAANGFVGIGTSSPTVALEVSGAIKVSGSADISYLFSPSSGATKIGQIHQSGDNLIIAAAGVGNIALFSLGAPVQSFVLNSSGYLGLGNSNPTQRLSVNGNININSTSSYMFNGVNLANASTTLGNFFFGNAGNLSVMTGVDNLGFGSTTLAVATSGYGNLAFGNSALDVLTSGYSNIAIGTSSLTALTTGYNNIALGNWSGGNLTTGYNNILIGHGLLTVASTTSNSLNIGNLISGDLALGSIGLGSTNFANGTTTVYNDFVVGNGALMFASSTGLTTIDNIELGATSFPTDAGAVSWIDMPLTSSTASGVPVYYTANLAGNAILSVTGVSNGAGDLLSYGIGIGTTTAPATLTVQATTSMAALNVVSSTGASMFAIAGNGNVGIGTSTPSYGFDIYSNLSATMRIKSGNSRGDALIYLDRDAQAVAYDSAGIIYQSNGSTNWFSGIPYNSGAPTSQFVIGSDNTLANSKFTILSNGNVGIGTSTPLQRLDVNGSIAIEGSNSIIFGNGVNGDWSFAAQNSNVVWQPTSNSVARTLAIKNSGGGVAFGFYPNGTHPSFDLVAGSYIYSDTNATSAIQFTNSDNSAVLMNFDTVNNRIGIGTSTATATLTVQATSSISALSVVSSSGASMFTIAGNGNVGIGTTSTQYLFDVAKGTSATARFWDQTAGTGATRVVIKGGAADTIASTLLAIDGFAGTGHINFSADANGGQAVFADNANGPGLKLGDGGVTVKSSGFLVFTTGDTNAATDLQLTRSAANTLKISSDGAAGLANIVVNGNVGIGTTTPAQKLDVAGNIQVNGTSSYMINGVSLAFGSTTLSSYFFGEAGNNTMLASAIQNTGVGYQALSKVTSGNNNTAMGYMALTNNTTGANNAAFGLQALSANINGRQNTAIGFAALSANTSGINNTANGFYSLTTNTTGGYNTALGYKSLLSNSTGTSSVALGVSAGQYELGSNAFYVNNIDQGNTASDKAFSLLYGKFSGVATSTAGQFLTVNGQLNVNTTTMGSTFNILANAVGGREGVMKAMLSDSGSDSFIIGNGTSDNNIFAPTFAGYVDSSNAKWSLNFAGMTNATQDASDSSSYGLVRFNAHRTDSAVDPLNGNLTSIVNRKLFTWENNSNVLMTMSSNGNVGIGTTTPISTLSVKGTAGTNPFTVASSSNASMFTVLQNGNVGIGTASPGYALTINQMTSGNSLIPALGVNDTRQFGMFNSASVGSVPLYGLIGGVLGSGSTYFQSQRVDGTATAYNILLQPSGGNVGIGTTTPQGKLHVYSNVAADTTSLFENAYSGNGSYLTVKANSDYASVNILGNNGNWAFGKFGGTNQFSIYDLTNSHTPFAIKNGAPENSFYMTATGKVGLGTYLAQNTLDVVGNVAIGSYAGTNAGPSNGLIVSGSVGLGTTSPQSILHLYGSTVKPRLERSVSSGATVLDFWPSGTLSQSNSVWSFGMIENNSNFSVNQWTGSQTMQRLLVDTNGNVGIGTTTPTGALHVVASSSSGVSTNFPGGNMAIFESERPGTAGNSYGIQVGKWGTYAVYMGINKNTASGAIPANAAYMGTYSKTYPLVLGQNIGSGDAATADLTIDNGKIGVGTTSPISTFSVKGSVGVNPFTIASSSNDTLLTVLQSGNVGIGTATPGSKLEVAGNVTITGGTLVLPNMALDEAGGSSLSQIRARNSLPLAFNTNNTVQAVITVAGSFGIGTTTPSAKLQITGTAGASDLFAISSSTNDRMLSVNSDGNLTINALNVNGAVYSNNGVLTNVNPSSQAYKNNITETNLNTDALLGLQVKSYNWNNNGQADFGLIAEDVKSALPELYLESNGTKGYRADHLPFYLLQIAQKQASEIKVLSEQISSFNSSTPLAVTDNSGSSFSTLAVQSSANFYGTITVKGVAGFESKVVFNQDIEVKGKIYASADQAGTATITANGTSTEVVFAQVYEVVPKVTAQAQINPKAFYWISDKTTKGFRINIDGQAATDTPFDWIVLAVKSDPNVAATTPVTETPAPEVVTEQPSEPNPTVLGEYEASSTSEVITEPVVPAVAPVVEAASEVLGSDSGSSLPTGQAGPE